MPELDTFTRHYLVAALWSTNDESTPSGGVPLDDNYDIDDIAPETVAKAVADCKAFQEQNAADLAEAYTLYSPTGDGDWSPEAQAGHDFWLTRNRHGVGFLDRGIGAVGDRLTEASKKFPEVSLYVGDDKLIYQ